MFSPFKLLLSKDLKSSKSASMNEAASSDETQDFLFSFYFLSEIKLCSCYIICHLLHHNFIYEVRVFFSLDVLYIYRAAWTQIMTIREKKQIHQPFNVLFFGVQNKFISSSFSCAGASTCFEGSRSLFWGSSMTIDWTSTGLSFHRWYKVASAVVLISFREITDKSGADSSSAEGETGRLGILVGWFSLWTQAPSNSLSNFVILSYSS